MNRMYRSISTCFIVAIMVSSCSERTSKQTSVVEPDTVAVDTVAVIEQVKPEKIEKVKPVEKQERPVIDAKEKTVSETENETPKEIGASPDAVYFLDDTDTECTPKFPEGDKQLKKLLKQKLRKAKKGEKAKFRASMVIKSDGSVGRVQFTECGYADEYKEEIIATLKSLPPFTPGTKDGVAVDSWYYLNYKR